MKAKFTQPIRNFLRRDEVTSMGHNKKYLKSATLLLSILLGFIGSIHLASAEPNSATEPGVVPKVAIIPITGEIEPSIFVFLERTIEAAQNAGVTTIVFKINTFGGRLDSAYNIVQLISSAASPTLETIAWVEDKAISAGTLIALSCNKLYMMPGSTLGDVAPVAMGGEGGVTMLGEKFQSPLRAKFRALAEQNDYPVKLTEAFVSADRAIFEVTYLDGSQTYLNDTEYGDLTEAEKQTIVKKRTVVAAGELLTMNEQEAITLGFSRGTTTDLADIIGEPVSPAQLSEYEVSQSEKILAFITRYAGILIFIGLAGLYLEAQNPGFGLFGSIAIIAFIVLGLGLFAVELATYAELALLITGMILIGVELFILPGLAIPGLLGVVAILGSLVLMLQDFSIPETPFQLELFRKNIMTIALAFLGGTILFFLSFFIFKNWRRSNPLVLQSTLSHEPTPPSQSTSTSEPEVALAPSLHPLQALIHAHGKTVSNLRPSGKVSIRDTLYDAITEGDYIKAGEPIKVVGITGASLVVSKS